MYIFTEKRKTDIMRLRASQIQAQQDNDVIKASACADAIDAELDDVLAMNAFVENLTAE